ncbi:PA2779 family protein [Lysobacter sp. A3-1-A15]|uniref:PA2779 family protein n=1 Tax=Novilysobacter viscosus TaxID=3098602 RepID=UPI002EDB50F5
MFRKLIVMPLLIVAFVFQGVAGTASAAVISTQQALSAEMRDATETRVRDSLARDEVRKAMQHLGVDPADADARVASLSDAELMQLQGELDRMPAGGSALAVIGVVFVVLLILELVGVTNIFNRV